MVENRVTSREVLMAIDGIGKVRADKYGSTALMFAVWNKKPDVVRALLSAGADVHAKNRNGETALGDFSLLFVILHPPCHVERSDCFTCRRVASRNPRPAMETPNRLDCRPLPQTPGKNASLPRSARFFLPCRQVFAYLFAPDFSRRRGPKPASLKNKAFFHTPPCQHLICPLFPPDSASPIQRQSFWRFRTRSHENTLDFGRSA